MKHSRLLSRTLALLLAATLCGDAQLAQAIQTTTTKPVDNTKPASESNAQGTAPATTSTPAELPNAPSSATSSSSKTAAQQQTPANAKDQQPLGTAAAEKGTTRGGAASKPAGTAIAGAKQKQSRSLLIKVGAIAAAGVALGTVYALSRGTSPTPPGALR